ncbi:hypothetical protein HOY82DRAFT_221030 [Tuber indicum]|nr:hypothetical protein HOY82DRAFT_221030 [Tuber indicum]
MSIFDPPMFPPVSGTTDSPRPFACEWCGRYPTESGVVNGKLPACRLGSGGDGVKRWTVGRAKQMRRKPEGPRGCQSRAEERMSWRKKSPEISAPSYCSYLGSQLTLTQPIRLYPPPPETRPTKIKIPSIASSLPLQNSKPPAIPSQPNATYPRAPPSPPILRSQNQEPPKIYRTRAL